MKRSQKISGGPHPLVQSMFGNFLFADDSFDLADLFLNFADSAVTGFLN
jgi:hypothetical protein